MFKLDYTLPDDMVYKIAETGDEIEQALRILHDGYVEKNLMDPSEHKIRITKYHFLPTSTILIGKKGDEVVATMSVIRDSQFKLPTDACWDLSPLRNQNLKIVEVSSLAIKKAYQKTSGVLLFPLCKYMYEYVSRFAKADILAITTHPQVRDFYSAILLFDQVEEGKVTNYDFVKGAKGIAQFLDLRTAGYRYREVYEHQPASKNMYQYFVLHEIKNFKFPNRKYNVVSDPVWTPEMMKHFIKCCPDIFLSLSIQEKMFLRETFFFDDYKNIIGHQESTIESQRKNIRFPVHCPSRVVINDRINVAITEEASRYGLKINNGLELQVGEEIKMRVEVGPNKMADLKGRIVWSNKKWAGISLLESSSQWHDFIDHMENIICKDSGTGVLRIDSTGTKIIE